MRKRKLLAKVASGSRNLRFQEVTALAESLGFHLARINGSHHIYSHPNVPELVNLQEVSDKAKPYQVTQLMQLAERYNLLDDEQDNTLEGAE